jgi:multifunctional methyltransferase subunit TRM112
MLQCNKKGCTSNNYPLALHAQEVSREESEFRPEFLKHMLTKLDYSALVFAAKAVNPPSSRISFSATSISLHFRFELN